MARHMKGMGLTVNASIHLTADRLRGIVRGNIHENNDLRYVSAISARQAEPQIPGASAKYAVGVFIVAPLAQAQRTTTSHLSQPLPGNTFKECVRGVARICLPRLRDRHLRQLNCRLESVAICQDRFCLAFSGFCAAKPCRVTDALEQALYARRPAYQAGLVHLRRRSLGKTMEAVGFETLKWPYGDASIAYLPPDRR